MGFNSGFKGLRVMNPSAYLAYFSMLKLVYYILVYVAQRLLMLDSVRLILLYVMKVVL